MLGSPEIHQHMPRGLTVRQALENAWADTFRSRPRLDAAARDKVDACLRWFAAELNPAHRNAGSSSAEEARDDSLAWADHYLFGELPFSAQRVALFIRAMIKAPDVVVLDEACSGMDDGVRNKCLLFLEAGETKRYASTPTSSSSPDSTAVIVDSEVANVRVPGLTDEQALICISHVREEIPDCVREWVCLPEANSGLPARFGVAAAPLATDEQSWNEIWGMEAGGAI